MRKILIIYFLLITTSLFAKEYNCREYRDINISKKDERKYSFDKEKNLAYKKKTIFLEDKKIVIEHYQYQGFFHENNKFFIKVFDANNNLVVKKEIKEQIYNFQAIKRAQKIILVLNTPNWKGANIKILSFDSKLNFNEIYKIEGRDSFFSTDDFFIIGDITLDDNGGFLLVLQLFIVGSAKSTYDGDFVIFYKFDKNNKLSWKRKLEIPKGTRLEDSTNDKIYIKDSYLYTPTSYNDFTNIKEINGCYIIYNDIANLYGYYAIDDDGYFWTKDPNMTEKVEIFLYPAKEEMSREDWISFIGFLLLLSVYFIYKKIRKK